MNIYICARCILMQKFLKSHLPGIACVYGNWCWKIQHIPITFFHCDNKACTTHTCYGLFMEVNEFSISNSGTHIIECNDCHLTSLKIQPHLRSAVSHLSKIPFYYPILRTIQLTFLKMYEFSNSGHVTLNRFITLSRSSGSFEVARFHHAFWFK